jgi:hypothetical protein
MMVLACAVVALGSGAVPPAGAATADAECEFSGLINFSPGITTTSTQQTLTFEEATVASDSASSCPLALGSQQGTLSGSLTTSSLRCLNTTSDTLVSGSDAVGRIKISWPDGSASRLRIHWLPVANKLPQPYVFRGQDGRGPYAGDTVLARTSHLVTSGHCSSTETPIRQISYFADDNHQIEHLLTFSPRSI